MIEVGRNFLVAFVYNQVEERGRKKIQDLKGNKKRMKRE